MEWVLENILMLIKFEYMSYKNYSCLYAVEKGKKISWAYIVHQKIFSKL